MMKRGLLYFTLILVFVSLRAPAAAAVPKRERASEFLARLSSYKTWSQVNRYDDDVSTATFKIEDSVAFAGG